MVLTTHSHPVPRFKKEWSNTSNPPLGLCGLCGEIILLCGLVTVYVYHGAYFIMSIEKVKFRKCSNVTNQSCMVKRKVEITAL